MTDAAASDLINQSYSKMPTRLQMPPLPLVALFKSQKYQKLAVDANAGEQLLQEQWDRGRAAISCRSRDDSDDTEGEDGDFGLTEYEYVRQGTRKRKMPKHVAPFFIDEAEEVGGGSDDNDDAESDGNGTGSEEESEEDTGSDEGSEYDTEEDESDDDGEEEKEEEDDDDSTDVVYEEDKNDVGEGLDMQMLKVNGLIRRAFVAVDKDSFDSVVARVSDE